MAEDYVTGNEDDVPGLADLSDAKLLRRMLLDVGVSLTEDYLGCHLEDDDSSMRDAAEALDLPAWAAVRAFSAGGPGPGIRSPGSCSPAGRASATSRDGSRRLGPVASPVRCAEPPNGREARDDIDFTRNP